MHRLVCDDAELWNQNALSIDLQCIVFRTVLCILLRIRWLSLMASGVFTRNFGPLRLSLRTLLAGRLALLLATVLGAAVVSNGLFRCNILSRMQLHLISSYMLRSQPRVEGCCILDINIEPHLLGSNKAHNLHQNRLSIMHRPLEVL